MKKYKLLFIFLFIFMLFNNVKGITLEECTTEKMNNLKEIANKIEFNYTYEMKTSGDVKYPEFKINASNLNNDLKALIIEDFLSMNYKEFKNDGKGNGSLGGFREGQNITITMKAYTADKCSTKTVLVKQVKLPYYNYLYDEEFCKTNPNFKYCTEFTDVSLSQSVYDKEMTKYLDSQVVEPPVVEENNTNIILIVGIGAGILLIGVLTVYIIIRRKKNSL